MNVLCMIGVSDMYVSWDALFIIYDAECVEAGSSYHLSLERILGVSLSPSLSCENAVRWFLNDRLFV